MKKKIQNIEFYKSLMVGLKKGLTALFYFKNLLLLLNLMVHLLFKNFSLIFLYPKLSSLLYV